MKAIIDLVLLGILILCAWSGFKKGLIMGIGGILCLAVSVYGANLLANTFSYDVVPALQPFVGGYTETLIAGENSEVMERMGWENEPYSADDLLEQNPERTAEFCSTCYALLGLDEGTADILAERTVQYRAESGERITESVVHVLTETAAYVGCFVLAFLIIVIILTVLGNLPNLSYKIPELDLLNDIGGTVLGLVTGVLYCALLVWALKYLGMLIGRETLSSAVLGRIFLNHNIFLNTLGI